MFYNTVSSNLNYILVSIIILLLSNNRQNNIILLMTTEILDRFMKLMP